MSSLIDIAVNVQGAKHEASHTLANIVERLALPVDRNFRGPLTTSRNIGFQKSHGYAWMDIEFDRATQDYRDGIAVKFEAVRPAWDGTNKSGQKVGDPRPEQRLVLKIEGGSLYVKKAKWEKLNLKHESFGRTTPHGMTMSDLLGTVISALFNLDGEMFDTRSLRAYRESKRSPRPAREDAAPPAEAKPAPAPKKPTPVPTAKPAPKKATPAKPEPKKAKPAGNGVSTEDIAKTAEAMGARFKQ